MKNLFPYNSIRPVQEQLIKDVEEALVSGKNLLVNAPTGLGKTAATLPAALAYALEKKKVVFFLTNRHTQHQIAIETLREIKEKHHIEFASVDVVGKQWMCSQTVELMRSGDFNEFCKAVRETGKCEFYEKMRADNKLSVQAKRLIEKLVVSAPMGTEELKEECQAENLCAYYIAMELAKKAQVIVADYYYLFNPIVRQTFFNRLGKELNECVLIIDEGHNLPGRVRELLSSKLSNFMLRKAIREAKQFGFNEVVFYLSQLQEVLLNLNEEKIPEVTVEKNEFTRPVEKIKHYEELIDELELAAEEIRKKQNKSYVGGVASFLSQWLGDDEGFVRFAVEKETKHGPLVALSYSCLDPSVITREIFQQVHASIIMSGTLTPTEMFRDVLGVERAVEKSYESPFPKENRLSLVVPTVSTKYTLRNPLMFKMIAEACGEIIDAVPGNVALFFPSYDLRDKIFQFFDCRKKIILEKNDLTKEEKIEMLEDFKKSKKEGAALLAVAAANFSEGVDLPGDLLNCVVVVGLPLAKPDLLTKKLIAYYEQTFSRGWDYGYTYPAINKVLQAAGRCIRSETDRGAIVFLDARFTWPSYAGCFKDWEMNVEEDYVRKIKYFFGKLN